MPALNALPLALVLAIAAGAQQSISFPAEDGGQICADLYGPGSKAVVLAHGGQFNKGSWRDQASALASAGFEVLAIDFRGFGCSHGPGEKDFDTAPFENDVRAAVSYLKVHGAKSISVVGASFGGGAAGDASIKSKPGEIDGIVFLGAAPNLPAENRDRCSLLPATIAMTAARACPVSGRNWKRPLSPSNSSCSKAPPTHTSFFKPETTHV